MNKALLADGIAQVYDVVLDLEMESMFGKEDTTISKLRGGLARILSATRHDGIYSKENSDAGR